MDDRETRTLGALMMLEYLARRCAIGEAVLAYRIERRVGVDPVWEALPDAERATRIDRYMHMVLGKAADYVREHAAEHLPALRAAIDALNWDATLEWPDPKEEREYHA
jgi:EAL domain-containing protein (putative c-di-GMP-specific phosphodiesterase class I)